jgi:hypothetical protein
VTLVLSPIQFPADVPCSVVVPKITPQVKCDAIQGYGAELTLCEKPTDRKDVCDKVRIPFNGLICKSLEMISECQQKKT